MTGDESKAIALERLKLLAPRAIAKIGVMLDDDDVPAMVHAKLVGEVLKYTFVNEDEAKNEGVVINVYSPPIITDEEEPV
jgi:hypothetical protein